MVSGRWGKPTEVLLDLVQGEDGSVRGVANPGRQNAPIRSGSFDAATGALILEGDVAAADGASLPFHITGRLDGRVLRLSYQFGDSHGEVEVVRVEEYTPPAITVREIMLDDVKRRLAGVRRWLTAQKRPTGAENAQALRARGESLASIVFRDAVAGDVQALAELHVTTWNATYNTSRGPTVATRMSQWTRIFGQDNRRDFVVVAQDRDGRLIGFTWGLPREGEFQGELSKIYLRWEYHGLGLGRRLMAETAQRFVERGIHSFILHAEISNPTIGFYDRMGGERLLDDRKRFTGSYGWRDVSSLVQLTP